MLDKDSMEKLEKLRNQLSDTSVIQQPKQTDWNKVRKDFAENSARWKEKNQPEPTKPKSKHQWRSMHGYTLTYDASTRFGYQEDSGIIPQKPSKKKSTAEQKKRKKRKQNQSLTETVHPLSYMKLTKKKFAEQETAHSELLQRSRHYKKSNKYIRIISGGMGRPR